ncbi:MAG: hypothetical protein PW843_15310 [Azospirillaceae bacterium]|nr:hypothetical protein [Azospirillaceae bacterium]
MPVSHDAVPAALTSTYLSDVVASPTAIVGNYHAIKGSVRPPADHSQTYVGVWAGPAVTGTYIARATASDNAGTFELFGDGVDFTKGHYTVAYYAQAYEGASFSLAATVQLSDGLVIRAQTSRLIIIAEFQSGNDTHVTVHYSTPENNDPIRNVDCAVIYRGTQVQVPGSDSVAYWPFFSDGPSAPSSGTFDFQLNAAMVKGEQYIIQYNMTNQPTAVSTYTIFTWTL